MIKVEEYKRWCDLQKSEKVKSGLYKSPIKLLFAPREPDLEFVFTPDNWNGGDILRHFLTEHFDENTLINNLCLYYYLIDDQRTVLILGVDSWYEISWYKNRGQTEIIRKNGEFITLEEYIELCNKLGVELT